MKLQRTKWKNLINDDLDTSSSDESEDEFGSESNN